MRGRRVVLYIDNSTALFALRKGRSRLSVPLNELCFSFWSLVRGLSVDAVVARVPARFNVADDPSRRVPPVGADVAPLPVGPELWARAFRPALFPAFGAPSPAAS